MKRVAMDIGTNSCRLLIATVEDGIISILRREMDTTRIGKGLVNSGRLDPEGMDKTLACLGRWSRLLRAEGVDSYQLVGTSAMREATNGQEMVRLIKATTGLTLQIISGEEEAELSYAGVKAGLALNQPPLVVDLGGGSTEFICYDRELRLNLSVALGAVRAFDLHWQDADFTDRLAPISDYRARLANHPLVMVGGTATTLAAVDLKMAEYDGEKLQGYRLSRQRILELYEQLITLSLEQRRVLPGLQPERADIIPYGAAIVLSIMKFLGREEITVADTDLLTALLLVD